MNARFWIWHNDGWVKLTLKPNQQLRFSCGGPTEEGYHIEYHSYKNSLNNRQVISHYDSYARDCDGPHEHHSVASCSYELLHEVVSDDGTERPEWQRMQSWHRDTYAERMGY